MSKAKKAAVITAAVLVVLAAIIVPLSLYFTGIIDYADPARSDEDSAYLMAYFTGNEPEQRGCFSL